MSTPNPKQPQPAAATIDPSVRLFLEDLLDEKGIFLVVQKPENK